MSNYYMNLPYDLAGSRSKNRFRNEMLWGLKKMLDLYRDDIDFTMVFDYSCDIEIHKTGNLEFYQVKTQNNNNPYKVRTLTKPNKTGDSVLGKLYRLKYDPQHQEQDDTILGLVSNAPLDDGRTTHNNIEIVDLAAIDSKAVKKIKNDIKKELGLTTDINLINARFERTGMDLINPDQTLIGEIVFFFEDTFQSEPKKVGMLFRLLKHEIENKASYELRLTEYKDILSKKGVSKGFLSRILNNYIEKTDIAVEKAKTFIEEIHTHNFKKKCKLLSSLSQVMGHLSNSNEQIKRLETDVLEWFKEKMDDLPDEELEIIVVIYEAIQPNKPIEISNEDIEALVILVMKKFEEGVYGV